jgi:hypothetical protein
MFERPASGEKAVLVQLDFGDGDYAERLSEFKLLAAVRRAQPLAVVSGKRARPDPALYAGKGKVAEIGDAADFLQPMSSSSTMSCPPVSSAIWSDPSAVVWSTAAA